MSPDRKIIEVSQAYYDLLRDMIRFAWHLPDCVTAADLENEAGCTCGFNELIARFEVEETPAFVVQYSAGLDSVVAAMREFKDEEGKPINELPPDVA